ncbi:MAG TPA: arginine--tRNA ligase [Thermosynergistes sp.]|nr:arginine--tRNA ligase [Thermosynergistes sp.]
MKDIDEQLKELFMEAVKAVAAKRGVELPEGFDIFLERPRRPELGDWATTVAMQLAKTFGERPFDLANEIISNLPQNPHVEHIAVAGPGFINISLTREWEASLLREILSSPEEYGRSDLGGGRRVQVEFVSANPTGPLHVGHGRGAAVGDVTANILAMAGWRVEREYYINDAGLQMELLGRSVQSRYFELLGEPEKAPFPEDGYKGDYTYDLARGIIEAEGDRFLKVRLEESLPAFITRSAREILKWIKKDLDDFRVHFDVWYSEKALYEKNLVDETISFLRNRGYTYEKDGALWFRSTAFGDEKDRVLIRSNGSPTYFASDVAYHKDKFDRGFDMVVDVWGADHHGYIPRMKAAVQALGRSPDDLKILLIQLVNLFSGEGQVSMSKRSGEFVTLRQVIDEVGVDATRYFFLMRRCDSPLDFDLELAKQASLENPVYYVQYACARINSIFREAASRGVCLPPVEALDIASLGTAEERKLIKTLSTFPEEVEGAAGELAPHRLVNFAYQLAGDFHVFYNANRVLGAGESLERSRLLLVRATQLVLEKTLGLLGISIPERM